MEKIELLKKKTHGEDSINEAVLNNLTTPSGG